MALPATRPKSSPRPSAAASNKATTSTSDQFKAGLAEVRTAIANLETRLIRWMVGTVIATATLTVGILRIIG